jgi:hypothetical protein
VNGAADGHYAKLWQDDDALWYFTVHDKIKHHEIPKSEGFARESSAIETIQAVYPGIEIRQA